MNIYSAVSVTITTTPQNLLSLIRTADPTIPPRGREVTVQNDPVNTSAIRFGWGTQGNLGATAPAGAPPLSATNCGYSLVVGASRTYRSDSGDATALPNIYVRCDTGTAQLNVEVIPKS